MREVHVFCLSLTLIYGQISKWLPKPPFSIPRKVVIELRMQRSKGIVRGNRRMISERFLG